MKHTSQEDIAEILKEVKHFQELHFGKKKGNSMNICGRR